MDNQGSFESKVKLHCQKLGTFKDLWTKELFNSNHFVGFSVINAINDKALIVASASTPSDGCVSISASTMFVCDLETGKTLQSLPYQITAAGLVIKTKQVHEDVGNGLSLLTTNDADNAKRSLCLYDLKNMKTMWSFDQPQINDVMLANGDYFYAISDGKFYKYSTVNGKLLWSHTFGTNINLINMGLINGECHLQYTQTIESVSYTDEGEPHLVVFNDTNGKVLSNDTFWVSKGKQMHTRIKLPFDGFDVLADWEGGNEYPNHECNLAFMVNGKTVIRTSREGLNDAIIHDGIITASDYGVTSYDMKGDIKWSSSYTARDLKVIDNMLVLADHNKWIFLNPKDGKFISWFWKVNTTTHTSPKIRLLSMLNWIGDKPGGILYSRLSDDMMLLQNHNTYSFAYSRGENSLEVYRLPKLH